MAVKIDLIELNKDGQLTLLFVDLSEVLTEIVFDLNSEARNDLIMLAIWNMVIYLNLMNHLLLIPSA